MFWMDNMDNILVIILSAQTRNPRQSNYRGVVLESWFVLSARELEGIMFRLPRNGRKQWWLRGAGDPLWTSGFLRTLHQPTKPPQAPSQPLPSPPVPLVAEPLPCVIIVYGRPASSCPTLWLRAVISQTELSSSHNITSPQILTLSIYSVQWTIQLWSSKLYLANYLVKIALRN